MSRRERDHFVSESAGQACIAYQIRPNGTMVTPSFWRTFFQPLQRIQFSVIAVLAALPPFLFSACATRRTLGRATPPGHVDQNGGHVENSCAVTLGEAMPPESSHTKGSR